MEIKDVYFETLYNSLKDRTFRLCLSYLKNRSDAEDALQNAFLNIYRYLPNFKGKSDISTWVYRICVNECLLMLRKRKSSRLINVDNIEKLLQLEEVKHFEYEEYAPHMPDRVLESKSKLANIYSANDGFSSENSNAIIAYLFMKDGNDAANSLGISVSAFKARLHRGRKSLKEILKSGDQ